MSENEYTVKLMTLIQIKDELEKSRRHATVLFADLRDSTTYKLIKTPLEAEAKIYLHNQTLTEVTAKHHGEVVKYLGDGIMAKFEGEDGEADAISVAIETLNIFKQYNSNPRLAPIDRIQTKVGINSGEVSFWKYKEQKELDPQGTVVDIAARLVGLAKPLQILCTADVKQKYEKKKTGIIITNSVPRDLKGVLDQVQVCEVIWDEKEMGVSESKHFSVLDPRIDSSLDGARQALGRGDTIKAISDCKHVLEFDNRHFLANLMLAQIYLSENKPKESLAHTRVARESNPESAMARALMAVVPWRVNEKDGKGPLSDGSLDSVIQESEIALRLAWETGDESAEFISMNALAYYLGMRYDTSNDCRDLDKAIGLCEYLEKRYDWIRLHRLSAFLDTYGNILIKKGDEKSLKNAREKLELAGQLNPIDPWPAKSLADLKMKIWRGNIKMTNE